MTPTLHHIPAPTSSPVARIDGGEAHHHSRPAVNPFGAASMRVLVACEYSGRVRDAFLARGHDAVSLDVLPTDAPGPHIVADVVDYLEGVADLALDLIIAHPPCTALTVAGNRTYGRGKDRHGDRLSQAAWTQGLWDLCCRKARRVAFENPVGVLSSMTAIPKPRFVHPWQFGHPEQKKTGLHLHNLPGLRPTRVVYDEMMRLPKNQRERLHYLPPSPDRWKIRSTTFQGIADAMAEQWGISFGAVAGSSSHVADAIHGTGFVLGPAPQTPGADGANRVNAGGIQ